MSTLVTFSTLQMVAELTAARTKEENNIYRWMWQVVLFRLV